jgi:hypothetical protein
MGSCPLVQLVHTRSVLYIVGTGPSYLVEDTALLSRHVFLVSLIYKTERGELVSEWM